MNKVLESTRAFFQYFFKKDEQQLAKQIKISI